MICGSEVSAAAALEPGLRLPSSRFLPSPDATANDDASRPMMTADVSTSVPLELLRSRLRNMGGKPPCWFPFPRQPGPPAQGCGPMSACRGPATDCAADRSGLQREDRPRPGPAPQLVRAAHLEVQPGAEHRPVDGARREDLLGA